MLEEIYELIKRYMYRNRSIDEIYITDVIAIMVYYYKLDDYILGDGISIEYGRTRAILYYFKKRLTVYINSFEEYLKSESDRFPMCKMSSLERKLLVHRAAIFALSHEVAHIEQIRDLDLGIKGAEGDVLNLAYLVHTGNVINFSDEDIAKEKFLSQQILKIVKKILLEREKILYNKYYKYAPEERLANERAHETIIDLLPLFSGFYAVDSSKLVLLERYRMLKRQLSSYDKTLAPTTFYFKKLYHERGLLECNRFNELGLDERFNLGLYLSKEELSSIISEQRELEKRIAFYI